MNLLAPSQLIATGPVDHADWNFRPVLGAILRWRFRMMLQLLGQRRYESLLEIGYGSGVFMPELAQHTRRLTGIDIHDRHREVEEVLLRNGVAADLHRASMANMPFPDGAFDCVVAVSAMEFVDDIDSACAEIRRVLTPGGQFVVITPGHSPLLDFGLWVLTRESAKKDFANRRERVVPALERHFQLSREIRWPQAGHQLVCFYRGLKVLTPARPRVQSIRQAESMLSVRT
jgi:ubiquinone/menaquinone biosynthesis C-methylase UbiE